MAFRRRSHTKKRTGCSNCKSRHIKCDEQGPPCANCRVRNLECTRTIQAQAPKETSASVAEPSPPVGDRSLELELFHRWATDTYRSFSFRPNDEGVWQLVVPQDALTYNFLLNALFAITSLHASTTATSAKAHAYQLAALEYQNLAIANFKDESLSVTPTNHQAMFAFSVINLALAIALPFYTGQNVNNANVNRADQDDVNQGLTIMFNLLQGVVSIFASSRTWLTSGPFQAVVARLQKKMPPDGLDAAQKNAMDRLRAANNEAYRSRCSDPSNNPNHAVSSFEAHSEAISKLEQCFAWYEGDGDGAVLRWLATLEPSFVGAITSRDPIAMLITMHWAILLDRLGKEKWWAKSSGKMIATELSMALKPHKPEWEPTISWVHVQVGLPPLTASN